MLVLTVLLMFHSVALTCHWYISLKVPATTQNKAIILILLPSSFGGQAFLQFLVVKVQNHSHPLLPIQHLFLLHLKEQ